MKIINFGLMITLAISYVNGYDIFIQKQDNEKHSNPNNKNDYKNKQINSKSDDLCSQYWTCDTCFKDPKCEWCATYRLCIVGNQTVPNEGLCDWYYYNCLSKNQTLHPKTALSPINLNITWLTYGGNSQHTGYIDYYYKITSSTIYKQIFEVTIRSDIGYYASAIAGTIDRIYFHTFNPGNYSDYLLCYSINDSNNAIFKSKMLNGDYSSAPSITNDYQYIVSLLGYINGPFIYPIIVDANTGEIIRGNLEDGYLYTGDGLVWSIIAPVIGDNNMVFFTASNADSENAESFAIGCTFAELQPAFAVGAYDVAQFSFQPAYYMSNVYYHFHTSLLEFDINGDYVTIYDGEEINIDYSTNMNNTISISIKNNILFVNGQYLCAFNINNYNKLWCKKMNDTQGTTPAVDDYTNTVFIYDYGYIYGYNQNTGNLTNKYGDGTIKNDCFTEYGCLSSQPIITPYNIIWGDGTQVLIYDKITEKLVLTIENICKEYVGNSIAWVNQYLFVSCRERVVGYQFFLL